MSIFTVVINLGKHGNGECKAEAFNKVSVHDNGATCTVIHSVSYTGVLKSSSMLYL